MKRIVLALLLFVSIAQADPVLVKIKRTVLPKTAISFDGKPADLEFAPFVEEASLFINLTDLIRHTGGIVIWGPAAKDGIAIYRNDLDLSDLLPIKTVNGAAYVPLRRAVSLMGMTVQWKNRVAEVWTR